MFHWARQWSFDNPAETFHWNVEFCGYSFDRLRKQGFLEEKFFPQTLPLDSRMPFWKPCRKVSPKVQNFILWFLIALKIIEVSENHNFSSKFLFWTWECKLVIASELLMTEIDQKFTVFRKCDFLQLIHRTYIIEIWQPCGNFAQTTINFRSKFEAGKQKRTSSEKKTFFPERFLWTGEGRLTTLPKWFVQKSEKTEIFLRDPKTTKQSKTFPRRFSKFLLDSWNAVSTNRLKVFKQESEKTLLLIQ